MSTTEQKKGITVFIRWQIRRDMPEILSIETKSFEFPWEEDYFMLCLRQHNCIGMVAEIKSETIAGFMIYELVGHRIHLLNFAVHPDWRRQGVGTQMIRKLIAKLSTEKIHQRIVVEVRETNLSAQIFFRKCGFKALNLLRGYYRDSSEDAYLMQYKYKTPDLLTNIIHSIQDLTTKPQ